MKAYELKALLATLDDSAEVSIELQGEARDYGNWPNTNAFEVQTDCGVAPRRACLLVGSVDLRVIPNAQERIEELEQQIDDLKEKTKDLLACCVRTGDDTRTDRAMDALEAIL